MNTATANKQVEALKASAFKQQKQFAFRPIPTYCKSVVCFTGCGIIFIVLGLVLFAASNRIVEIVQRYDDVCLSYNVTCDLQLTISQDITEPLYVYYEINGLLQNHRLYKGSKNLNQLKGQEVTLDEAKLTCDPVTTNQ